MSSAPKSAAELLEEIAELRALLIEANETLEAIRTGAVDALVVGEQVFTLKGADQTYRALVEAMNEGAVTLTSEGSILYCNQRFADMVETPLEKAIGKSFFHFVKTGWKEACYQFIEGSLHTPATTEVLLIKNRDHSVFAHLSSSPFPIEDRQGISLVVTDITARKQAEEELRRSEERFQNVARITNDAIWEWDAVKDTFWRSEAFTTLFRHPPATLGTDERWWRNLIHPEDRAVIAESYHEFIRLKKEAWTSSYRFRRGDGTYADVLDRARMIRDEKGGMLRVVGTLADITEQKKAEEAKRQLSKNILDAQEQERHRVARELHDGVNQLLSSSKFRLHSIEKSVSSRDRQLGKQIAKAKELIDKSIGEIRAISRNLRPSELDDLGLSSALRSLCEEFQQRTLIPVQMKNVLPDALLSRSAELTVYRITQEALNNVAKHANATCISIHLAKKKSRMALTISDDGNGFDPAAIRKTKTSGWGLENMRERASYVRGTVNVESAIGEGTEIRVEIPIE